MKSVLISIQPKWCELIASAKKTVEVRKTKPNLETPFKVYIYCTASNKHECLIQNENGVDLIYAINYKTAIPCGGQIANGKVIGEFVCDEITPLFNVATTSWNLLAGNVHEYAKVLVRMARLTEEEMHSYAKGKNCYAWHISDLVIYSEPRELSEFKKAGFMTEEDWLAALYPNTHCHYEAWAKKFEIKKAPQSWCYVEEV